MRLFIHFLKFQFVFLLLSNLTSLANPILGFNITDVGAPYDYLPAANPNSKSFAQVTIDEIQKMGGTHIVLNIRAHMHGPRSADIRLVVLPEKENQELANLRQLIQYAHAQNLTVGLRPILLVLGPKGEFPFQEGNHLWWHGNVNPADKAAWFNAFEKFILHYSDGLENSGLDEFTIGAEMQSMMVGMGSDNSAYLIGQPERWLNLFNLVRAKHPAAKITYDINYPETLVPLTNTVGGEFERWRHIIVDLQGEKSAAIQKKRMALIQLWQKMDFIGLDFYRYLATSTKNLPTDLNGLTEKLSTLALTHATQIDNALGDISLVVGVEKKLAVKEIGYRSVENAFINPADYASGGGTLNITHQAASYKAISNAFLKSRWPWLYGIYFWDISVDPDLKGPADKGFSPLGKKETLTVIQEDYVRFLKP